jgi:hypothetical protein
MCGAGSEEVLGHLSFSSRTDHLLLLQRPSYSLLIGAGDTSSLVPGLPDCWHPVRAFEKKKSFAAIDLQEQTAAQ